MRADDVIFGVIRLASTAWTTGMATVDIAGAPSPGASRGPLPEEEAGRAATAATNTVEAHTPAAPATWRACATAGTTQETSTTPMASCTATQAPRRRPP